MIMVVCSNVIHDSGKQRGQPFNFSMNELYTVPVDGRYAPCVLDGFRWRFVRR